MVRECWQWYCCFCTSQKSLQLTEGRAAWWHKECGINNDDSSPDCGVCKTDGVVKKPNDDNAIAFKELCDHHHHHYNHRYRQSQQQTRPNRLPNFRILRSVLRVLHCDSGLQIGAVFLSTSSRITNFAPPLDSPAYASARPGQPLLHRPFYMFNTFDMADVNTAELTKLGRPLWRSPLAGIASFAAQKLMGGSLPESKSPINYKQALAAVLCRVRVSGVSHTLASDLVAEHMAVLQHVHDDRKQVCITYHSEVGTSAGGRCGMIKPYARALAASISVAWASSWHKCCCVSHEIDRSMIIVRISARLARCVSNFVFSNMA